MTSPPLYSIILKVALFTLVYTIIAVCVDNIPSKGCLHEPCNSEAIDNTTAGWVTDYVVSVLCFCLSANMLLTTVDKTAGEGSSSSNERRAAAAFGSFGIAYIFGGVAHHSFPNSGSDDGKGMVGFFLIWLCSFIFATGSLVLFYFWTRCSVLSSALISPKSATSKTENEPFSSSSASPSTAAAVAVEEQKAEKEEGSHQEDEHNKDKEEELVEEAEDSNEKKSQKEEEENQQQQQKNAEEEKTTTTVVVEDSERTSKSSATSSCCCCCGLNTMTVIIAVNLIGLLIILISCLWCLGQPALHTGDIIDRVDPADDEDTQPPTTATTTSSSSLISSSSFTGGEALRTVGEGATCANVLIYGEGVWYVTFAIFWIPFAVLAVDNFKNNNSSSSPDDDVAHMKITSILVPVVQGTIGFGFLFWLFFIATISGIDATDLYADAKGAIVYHYGTSLSLILAHHVMQNQWE